MRRVPLRPIDYGFSKFNSSGHVYAANTNVGAAISSVELTYVQDYVQINADAQYTPTQQQKLIVGGNKNHKQILFAQKVV